MNIHRILCDPVAFYSFEKQYRFYQEIVREREGGKGIDKTEATEKVTR